MVGTEVVCEQALRGQTHGFAIIGSRDCGAAFSRGWKGYDKPGNVIQNGSTTYTYDNENRITSVGASGASYLYAAAGLIVGIPPECY